MSRSPDCIRLDQNSFLLDISSNMKEEAPTSLNDRIAQRVRDLRADRALSLDALATHCGVSRSMISLIERGESSPTAVLLEKLATGLGVSLASLFDAPAPRRRQPGVAPRGPAAVARPALRLPAAQRLARRLPFRRSRSSRCCSRPRPAWPTRRRARAACAPAGVGARRASSTSRWATSSTAWSRRLPRDGARPPHELPQPHAQARALCRRDRHEPAGDDEHDHHLHRNHPACVRLPATTDAQIEGLADVLIDCVEGGASVSFMLPLSRERATRLLARRGRGRGARRARAAGGRRRRRHRGHRATGAGPAREPAAPRRPGQDAGAPPRAAPGHRRAADAGGRNAWRANCGKTLLVLDTSSAEAERLYARMGWTARGQHPRLRAAARGRAVRHHLLLSNTTIQCVSRHT
jgi:transcriptional regulator with XRE-family HTH domain